MAKYTFTPSDMPAPDETTRTTLAQLMRRHGISFVESAPDIFGRGRSVATIKGELYTTTRAVPSGTKSYQFRHAFMRTEKDTARLSKILGREVVEAMLAAP